MLVSVWTFRRAPLPLPWADFGLILVVSFKLGIQNVSDNMYPTLT